MQFSYKETSGIKESEINKSAKTLSPYLDQLTAAAKDTAYSTPEACLALVNDNELLNQINELVQKKKTPHLHEVMVVGIGGSSLGSCAVYRALRISPPARGGVGGGGSGINLSFYDTVDNHQLIQAIETIRRVAAEGRQVILNIISKSGTTLETLANARVLLKVLQEVSPDWKNQVVITSEPESKLTAWAKEQGIDCLPNPKNVGGRFSVMSAVGLFPLAMAGVDISSLHDGGKEVDYSLACQSAAVIYANYKAGKIMHDLFLFDKDLEDLGKWHRQLVGESLGKSGQGITPLVSIGSADLHSMFQLYISGPKDKFTSFVTIDRGEHVKVEEFEPGFDALAPDITKKTLTDIMTAIVAGVKEAYKKHDLPYVEFHFEAPTEKEFGRFLQFKLVEVMCLAKLMGVDAFGQSSVEEYKKITEKLLAE